MDLLSTVTGFIGDLLKGNLLPPAWRWVKQHRPASAAIAVAAGLVGFDLYQQTPPYLPTAGWQRYFRTNCDSPDDDVGDFNVDSRGYKPSKWEEAHLVAPIHDQPPLGLNQTKSIVITTDRPLTNPDGTLTFQEPIGDKLRNTQFNRIELAIPKYWLEREIQFSVALAWENLEIMPDGYPGTVAVNIAYWNKAKKVEHVVLLSEAVKSMSWRKYPFPPVRLPRGTTSAVLRLGLHGASGQLYIDDAKFNICR